MGGLKLPNQEYHAGQKRLFDTGHRRKVAKEMGGLKLPNQHPASNKAFVD
jgi:hypothetical protein